MVFRQYFLMSFRYITCLHLDLFNSERREIRIKIPHIRDILRSALILIIVRAIIYYL